ncbi:unnamed protein product [Brachionus calyciflorus]|uniref:Ribosome biogenesis protein SLX9 n=1 Tax=Brachionus calyciflorus TaxID=104777 RepID=A0A814I9R2_9BILA|nr:unnamed protein product [Brachionus calyciflorus]
MGKLRSLKNNSLTNSKKKIKIEQNKLDNADNDDESIMEDEVETQGKKNNLIKKVQFKKVKKENKSAISKLKKSDDPNKEKYESIKNNLLKQIKESEKAPEGVEDKKEELNFRNRTNRLTNSLIKSILKNDQDTDTVKKLGSNSSNLLALKNSKSISKKAKDKLKKQVWHERIGLIKNELKEKVDKVKREKTVITGDMKPMIESLNKQEDTKTDLSDLVKVSDKSNDLSKLSRKEKREKNLENQKAKVTQKQSIRNKTSNDDINLFNQLLDYSEFTNNPLATLKKHLNK